MKRRSILKGAGALAATSAFGPAFAKADPSQGQWSAKADMPFAVQEIYPTRHDVGGKTMIVNAGGLAGTITSPFKKGVTVYDPVGDRWSRGTNLPEARHHLALSSVGGVLHAVGGFRREGVSFWAMRTEHWRIENPLVDTWSDAAPLPAPQAEAVTVHHNGLIHMIGGRTPASDANKNYRNHTDTGVHRVYDPQADKWSVRAPLPTPRNSAAGAVLNGEIFVVSGRTIAMSNTPVCEVYNPKTDSWRTIAPLPEPLRQSAPRGQGGLAAAAFKGKVYAFGGEWFGDVAGVYGDTWEYDPQKDAWRAVAAIARPRHGLGAVALENGIYVIGGATGASAEGTSPFLDLFEI